MFNQLQIYVVHTSPKLQAFDLVVSLPFAPVFPVRQPFLPRLGSVSAMDYKGKGGFAGSERPDDQQVMQQVGSIVAGIQRCRCPLACACSVCFAGAPVNALPILCCRFLTAISSSLCCTRFCISLSGAHCIQRLLFHTCIAHNSACRTDGYWDDARSYVLIACW